MNHVERLAAEIADILNQIKKAEQEKVVIRQQVDVLSEQVDVLNERLNRLNGEIASKKYEITHRLNEVVPETVNLKVIK